MADLDRYAAQLAVDLGAPERHNPVERLIAHAEGIVEAVRRSRTASKLSTLVDAVADKLGMRFEVVGTDDDLRSLQERYADFGETGFVALALGLADPECYGGTISLQHPCRGIKFVAVIDARGSKRHKTYFTKCHEVAHILLATRQQLLAFRGRHKAKHHPQELLVDRVASFLGFYEPLLRPYHITPLSFDLVHSVIDELCPEASWESAVRGVVGTWPYPAVWLRAELLRKRAEESGRSQPGGTFLAPKEPKLRISNAPAVSLGWPPAVKFRKQVRIPTGSVISAVFESGVPAAATEDLASWDVSGVSFPSAPVRVMARQVASGIVEAMVVADARPH
jgi:hypothetical protein